MWQIRSDWSYNGYNSAPLTGFFYGGGLTVLKAQAIGSFTITFATFAVSLAVMYFLKAIKLLRVSAEGEMYGLDLHEHGIPAYPEYVISSLARPAGLAEEELPRERAAQPLQNVRASEPSG